MYTLHTHVYGEKCEFLKTHSVSGHNSLSSLVVLKLKLEEGNKTKKEHFFCAN